MNIDVIILTKSDSAHKIGMTKRTMLHMKEADPEHQFHFHLVESAASETDKYSEIVDTYITPKEKFNYNRFINFAIPYIKHEWVVISNNDVSYEKGWFTEILKIHEKRPDIHSFSPKDPLLYMLWFDYHFVGTDIDYFESYKVSEAVMGWSLIIKKESLDKITPFDELFDMYYQDNDYAMMLQTHGIKHALVKNSIAAHAQTATIPSILQYLYGIRQLVPYSDEKLRKMKIDEIKFRRKWNQYE